MALTRSRSCVMFVLAASALHSLAKETTEQCYSDHEQFDSGCQAVNDEAKCRKQAACRWGVTGKCTAKSADFAHACSQELTVSDCEEQVACQWTRDTPDHTDKQSLSPPTAVIVFVVAFITLMGLALASELVGQTTHHGRGPNQRHEGQGPEQIGVAQQIGVGMVAVGISAVVAYCSTLSFHIISLGSWLNSVFIAAGVIAVCACCAVVACVSMQSSCCLERDQEEEKYMVL